MLKLNIGCGRDIKPNFCNIDIRENIDGIKPDLILDITKEFPFENNSVEYIYAEHFIEHLNWLDGIKFIINCYTTLRKGGILRLVLPDYKKIFQKYLEGDCNYFKVFIDSLNENDLKYYLRVYNEPEKVRKERLNNPPPDWHFTDKKKLKLRLRKFDYLIKVVDWFVHQFGEHKILYDFESLEGLLKKVGFSKIIQTNRKKIDSNSPTRVKSSLYVEGIK